MVFEDRAWFGSIPFGSTPTLQALYLPGSLVSWIFVHVNCFCPLISCRTAASIVRLFERYVAAALLRNGIKTTTATPAAVTRRRERFEARNIEATMTKGTNKIGFTM